MLSPFSAAISPARIPVKSAKTIGQHENYPAQYENNSDEELQKVMPSFDLKGFFISSNSTINFEVLNMDDICCKPGFVVVQTSVRPLKPDFLEAVGYLHRELSDSEANLNLERESPLLLKTRIEKLTLALQNYRNLL